MNSHAEIIEALGDADVAEGLSVKRQAVQKWRLRNSIPPLHWRPLILHARTRGMILSADRLLELAEKRG